MASSFQFIFVSEPKTIYRDVIEEAEQVLKALRMEDQNNGSGGKADS